MLLWSSKVRDDLEKEIMIPGGLFCSVLLLFGQPCWMFLVCLSSRVHTEKFI